MGIDALRHMHHERRDMQIICTKNEIEIEKFRNFLPTQKSVGTGFKLLEPGIFRFLYEVLLFCSRLITFLTRHTRYKCENNWKINIWICWPKRYSRKMYLNELEVCMCWFEHWCLLLGFRNSTSPTQPTSDISLIYHLYTTTVGYSIHQNYPKIIYILE
jgi:hypothetical protein